MTDHPTIFALSTVPGRSAIAVIRLSGPAVRIVLHRLVDKPPEPRRAVLRRIRDPNTHATLDYGLVLFFSGPASETGEDLGELQVHGGRAVVASILSCLGRMPECRMAEPGEFARRAFDNGKLDLAQVEGLADLVEAETEGQRRQALRQVGGVLSNLYEDWRRRLIEAAALVEAVIDFSDESDVSDKAFEQARRQVEDLDAVIRNYLDDGNRGEILREGFRVVIAGPPNVGKSSLLNAMSRRDAAIVSDEAGTTRDVIEVRLDLNGLPIILTDTAGLRESTSVVEQEGMRRSLAQVRQADLVLWLIDATTLSYSLPEDVTLRGDADLVVLNKIDLVQTRSWGDLPPGSIGISAKTGTGLAELSKRVAAIASERIGDADTPAITQVRHRHLVEECAARLTDFLTGDAAQVELRAEELRLAAHALGRITGRVDVEDVLGQIFSRFCIGK